MSYELGFLKSALKEWRKLDANTRAMFRKKLSERCQTPHIPAARLCGDKDRYKIKLHSVGYRLVYEVRDPQMLLVVVAVGRRNRNEIYKKAHTRRI